MRQLIIGIGEIGQALKNILQCDSRDIDPSDGIYDVLHICFPYNNDFNLFVKNYTKHHSAGLVIIHSTVPIGTCEELGAVSSPCRGVHPHLEEGIRTFVKFFGGKNAEIAASLFSDKGIDVYCSDDSRSIEAFKLWDTTIYGINILVEKEIYRFCTENNLNFDTVYTRANLTYNAGYEKLNFPQFKKYVLKHVEGPIGGHCVIPNCYLLDSWVSKLIKQHENIIPCKTDF